MFRFRLSNNPSVLAMVMDVWVVWIALPLAWNQEFSPWQRVVAGSFALVATVLGVRSTVLLVRRSRAIPE